MEITLEVDCFDQLIDWCL